MSLREDLVEHSTRFLPPGSQIRQAFICQTAPNFAFFLVTYFTGLTMFWIKYRLVVTLDAIYVLDSTKRSGGARPKSLLGKLPRHTQLGPVSGRWGNSTFSASATGSTNASTPTSPPPTVRPVSDTEHPGNPGNLAHRSAHRTSGHR